MSDDKDLKRNIGTIHNSTVIGYALCLRISPQLFSGANVKATSKEMPKLRRIGKTALNQHKFKIAIKMDGLVGL